MKPDAIVFVLCLLFTISFFPGNALGDDNFVTRVLVASGQIHFAEGEKPKMLQFLKENASELKSPSEWMESCIRRISSDVLVDKTKNSPPCSTIAGAKLVSMIFDSTESRGFQHIIVFIKSMR